MNLDHVTAIKEELDHFVIDHEMKGKFRLKKSAIPADVADSIRSVMKGKQAAAEAIKNEPDTDGVLKAADGAAVESPEDAANRLALWRQSGERGPLPPPPQGWHPGPIDQATLDANNGAAPSVEVPAHGPYQGIFTDETTAQQAADTLPAARAAFGPTFGVDSFDESTDDPKQLATAKASGKPLTVRQQLLLDAAKADAPTPAAALPPEPLQPTSVLPSQPPPSREGRRIGGGGAVAPKPVDTSIFDKGITEQQRGLKATADAIEETNNRQADIEAQHIGRMARIENYYNEQTLQNAKQQQASLDWFADPKNNIDPNRLFHSKSTANQVGTAISILLGGIGGGLTHSPNAALEIINKAIDQDIDAQKEAREDRKTRLNYYIGQGMRIQEAARMAKSDATADVAGLLRAEANRAAGPAAQAALIGASGKLASDSLLEKNNIIRQNLEIQHLPQFWADQHAMLGLQRQQLQLQQQAAQQTRKQQENLAAVRNQYFGPQTGSEQIGSGGVGRALPDGLLDLPGLEDKKRSAVRTLDGTYVFAADPKHATALRDLVAKTRDFQSKLNRISDFSKNVAGTFGTITGSPNNSVANSIHSDAVTALHALSGINRFSDSLIDLMEKQLPEPGSFQTAKTEKLVKELQARVGNALNDELYAHTDARKLKEVIPQTSDEVGSE